MTYEIDLHITEKTTGQVRCAAHPPWQSELSESRARAAEPRKCETPLSAASGMNLHHAWSPGATEEERKFVFVSGFHSFFITDMQCKISIRGTTLHSTGYDYDQGQPNTEAVCPVVDHYMPMRCQKMNK